MLWKKTYVLVAAQTVSEFRSRRVCHILLDAVVHFLPVLLLPFNWMRQSGTQNFDIDR